MSAWKSSLRRAATAAALLLAAPAAAAQEMPAFDLEALERAIAAPEAAVAPAPRLMALVSFAMPAGSLERLARDAAVLGAPLLLRGLHEESLRRTAAAAAAADPTGRAEWLIEPRPFAELGLQGVPVFLLEGGGERLLVRGDVSFAYALDYMAGQSHPLAAAAASYRARLTAAAER
ncbi:MAG: hypothetical protein ISN26_03030 [Betaproteobacteria bacterium AqS2]|uniref:Type-F conjugative transfer system pilin assembly protein TrbC n=1 Tax=Candidatus Amphirhobacter heronislandensis TaxID=1732024 RepID=A0A930UGX7_9GAMM|nr:hypothetical protein [Betaproteobacteria bacterium AqS2]